MTSISYNYNTKYTTKWKHALALYGLAIKREKGRDLTQSVTNAPTPTDKTKKQRDNIKNATKNFDYTTIADRLRTVSWSNSSHPTGVVKPVYERSTFPLTATAV